MVSCSMRYSMSVTSSSSTVSGVMSGGVRRRRPGGDGAVGSSRAGGAHGGGDRVGGGAHDEARDGPALGEPVVGADDREASFRDGVADELGGVQEFRDRVLEMLPP